MWSLVVVLVPKRIEALLWGADRGRWRLGRGLLHRAMEPFMPTVLTWATRIDPFGHDAQFDPPDRQSRQTTRTNGGERRPVISPQPHRQAVFPKRRFEQWPHLLGIGSVMHALATQHHTAVRIGDGQRIAAHAICGPKPAFEIGAPRVVGLADRAKRLRARWHMGTWRTPRDRQPSARQDGPTRAGDWPLLLNAVQFVGQWLELLGSPAWIARLGPQHRRAHVLGDGIGVMAWPTRMPLQAVQPLSLEVHHQFVPRLATDPEGATQLSHTGLVLAPAQHELETLLHG